MTFGLSYGMVVTKWCNCKNAWHDPTRGVTVCSFHGIMILINSLKTFKSKTKVLHNFFMRLVLG